MNCHRIKLLITLVLSVVVVAVVWTSSPADARGSSRDAPGFVSAVGPGVTLTSGDPDIGQGVAPPPHPTQGKSSQVVAGGSAKGSLLSGWVFRASRIWATLYLSIWR
jgi:hypothetical protein